ncbi:MAG: hypothetical protein ACRBBN_17035 [Methyloligellaceae bacterium]
MNFRSYLESFDEGDISGTPEGIFIEDALDDDFFESVQTWQQVEIHLVLAQASLESIEAGKKIWLEFSSQ